MQPHKSEETLQVVNAAADEAYPLVEHHILKSGLSVLLEDQEDMLRLLAANLIGLLIQSYDAGRGILSNALLHYAQHAKSGADYSKLVIEMLRYDPPVHNTRRILMQNVTLNGLEIKAGEAVLLVLAAANRDPQRFANPAQFDQLRPNNSEHLTFGAGAHECLARHYIVKLVVETLEYLSINCPNLRILTDPLEFEPLINVRLPRMLQIAF